MSRVRLWDGTWNLECINGPRLSSSHPHPCSTIIFLQLLHDSFIVVRALFFWRRPPNGTCHARMPRLVSWFSATPSRSQWDRRQSDVVVATPRSAVDQLLRTVLRWIVFVLVFAVDVVLRAPSDLDPRPFFAVVPCEPFVFENLTNEKNDVVRWMFIFHFVRSGTSYTKAYSRHDRTICTIVNIILFMSIRLYETAGSLGSR